MNMNNSINTDFELDYFSNDTCRTCSVKCVSHDLFLNEHDMLKKLMAVANVEIVKGDGLPSCICSSCHHLINVSYNFKCQVEKTNAIMRKVFEKASSFRNTSTTAISQSDSIEIIVNKQVQNENNANINTEHIKNHDETSHCIITENPNYQFIEPMKHAVKNVDILENDEKLQFHIENSDTTHCTKRSISENKSNEISYQNKEFIHENIPVVNNNIMKCSDLSESEISCGSGKIQNENFRNKLPDKDKQNSDDDGNDEEIPLISRTKRKKCPKCIKTFTNRLSLQKHMLLHKQKEKISNYICYLCDEQFSTTDKLKSHMQTFHEIKTDDKTGLLENNLPTGINICKNYKNKSEESNSQNESIVEQKNCKFTCKVCSKQFTYYKSFVSHAKNHPDYKEFYNVYLELVGFDSLTSVERDEDSKNSKHNTENNLEENSMSIDGVQCKLCGKLFATKRNLKRHLLTHSGLRYNCPKCRKEFSRMDKLKEHEQAKHRQQSYGKSENESKDKFTDDEDQICYGTEDKKKDKSNRPHKCNLCSKAFAQAQSLSNHMDRHKRVKDTQKRFLCEVCSKCFAQSGSLVAHMRTHTGVKPYICNVCNRAFTKSTYLQLHLRTHSGEKPYICQYCSRAFARANTLARHITMHTGEAKYHCQICAKSFRRLTSLNEHTYTHTGQRPYACKICSKRYNNAGSLYAHAKKCKSQYLSNQTTTYPISIDNSQSNAVPVSQMFVYNQKKVEEDTTIEQISPSTEFVIANTQNQKSISTNVVQPFVIDDSNVFAVNGKQMKASCYTIYSNM